MAIVELQNYEGEDRVISSIEMGEEIRRVSKGGGDVFRGGIPTLDTLLKGFAPGELITISGITKHGKCHGAGTTILMYDGSIKPVENITVGDVLMGDDSTPRHVLSTTSGYGELYEIAAKGGTPYTCNEDHILCLERTGSNKTKRGRPYQHPLDDTITEITLREYLVASNGIKHKLKAYRVGVEFPAAPVLIDPYFLGVWLGDGTKDDTGVTTADQEIVDFIYRHAASCSCRVSKTEQKNNKSSIYRTVTDRGQRNPLLDNMRLYGLIGTKHIPKAYLVNSRQVRLKLLAGLVDTDGGTVCAGTLGNALEITQKGKGLANDILFLVRSLGYSATITKIYKTIKSRGFVGQYWRIRFNGNTNELPCLLERKKIGAYVCKKHVLRSSFTVTPIGAGKYYGFTLDGNGRYLLSDFQVTHNTTLARSITVNLDKAGLFCLWFTYELPPKQFMDTFPTVPFFYLPRRLKSADMDWVEARIMEGLQKFHTRVIFIDHLHYLFDLARSKNVSLDIGSVVRRLKLIAVREEIVIFLMAHTVKPKLEVSEMGFEGIRDSSIVSQESDVVLMVRRRPDVGDNAAEVSVEFSRRTGAMKKKVYMCLVGGLLRESAYEFAEPKQERAKKVKRYMED